MRAITVRIANATANDARDRTPMAETTGGQLRQTHPERQEKLE
ncbi:hypothetical protein RISW2_17305 [Roseivivax isoporae LMG 25204]|uniref:Uncharacterized protein n=1 Tax=Roseivivax isoporae LMG 25204 TaxID=1449351 RepID=X7F2L5_9RHOB|nr:hypothetical protein RISW2_17305 [Roseivivax isoporae LMG 25204]